MNQMQQELQNELTTANQLLLLISDELSQIKQLTNPDGEFATNIIKNASIVKTLADLQKVDLRRISPQKRQIDEQHNNPTRDSEMDDTQ